MFYQIFLSPQVKRWTIINYKHGIYELPHELPNDLTLRKLGNMSKLHRMMAQCQVPPSNQNKSFVNASKTVPKNSN